ncbi:MAG: DUF3298 domain-containing protein [Bacteroidetes bacterium]|nr:DUF3298 domain-containing protein [Bacteroidota bacterium]
MRSLYLLLLFPILLSCSRHKTTRVVAQEGKKPQVMIEGLDGNFYKRYSGTIAGKTIAVHLQRWNGILYGTYQYISDGRIINLEVNPDVDENDDIVLFEQPGDLQPKEQPSWHIQITEVGINGQWVSADGTQQLPIELKENYPEGSIRLKANYLEDSALLLPERPNGAKAISTYEYLVPSDPAELQSLTQSIINCICPSITGAKTIEEAIKKEAENFFGDYQKTNREFYKKLSEQQASFSFNYTYESRLCVLENYDSWLVAEYFYSIYTGGAHANYGYRYLNYDRSTQREWTLNEVVTDTALLTPALFDAAILYFQLKPGESFEDRLLVDKIPVTSNFYLSKKGITFVYNPYEIASYADGKIALFIPYNSILQLLTPTFITRMHLSENKGIVRL